MCNLTAFVCCWHCFAFLVPRPQYCLLLFSIHSVGFVGEGHVHLENITVSMKRAVPKGLLSWNLGSQHELQELELRGAGRCCCWGALRGVDGETTRHKREEGEKGKQKGTNQIRRERKTGKW